MGELRTTLFVNVLLPLPVAGYFTYRVPFEMNESIEKGKRVVVQFGKKKIYTALIHSITSQAPGVPTKYILGVLDLKPIVNDYQFLLWEWISAYYLCYPGEVMNAALPSALKLASETRIRLLPGIVFDEKILTEKEFLLLDALQQHGPLTITDAARFTDVAKIIPLIHTLIERGFIVTEEEIKERFRPKIATIVSLCDDYLHEDNLQQIYSQLEAKAPRQLEVLMEYIQQSRMLQGEPIRVMRKDLLSRIPEGAPFLKALIKKGILVESEIEISRFDPYDKPVLPDLPQLTPHQQQAFDKILHEFEEKNVVLLHGVTSSGKTEIFIRLIRQALDEGKQVLYLLPEIALTSQIINRLQRFFGSETGVYHSKYNENERVEVWQNVAGNTSSAFQVILGARSALFLPYNHLGLIIVDEEHDPSFKQYDPAPRYNARDAAIYLAAMHGAKVLLGSATPSIESYHNAILGKYGMATLTERYGGIHMPEIRFTDLRLAYRDKSMHSMFSTELLNAIHTSLSNQKQVILFQNRRGFSLHIACHSCHWIPQCIRCDVSLVYHKNENRLRCHYCGYSTHIPDSCPQCGNRSLLMKGFGTEKIEEELVLLVPGLRVARMDLDSTRTKNALSRIISDFDDHKIDVLVGTQMVTKGLDFGKVILVGIMNADHILSYPDFRAFERGFQLMAQVAGRAGRRDEQGQVLIQTYNVSHPVLKFVEQNDYEGFYRFQIAEREKFLYPPFSRIVLLSLRHDSPELLNQAADHLVELLRKVFGSRVLGPEYPTVSKIRNQYLKNIIVKFEKKLNLVKAKAEITKSLATMHQVPEYRAVRVVIDVDPV